MKARLHNFTNNKNVMKYLYVVFFMIVCALPAQSQTMLTVGQVYDFNVNDEFQYVYQDAPPNAFRFKVIAKYYSALNDTVFYIRSVDDYHSEVNMTPTPHLDYFFDTYTDTVFYTNLTSNIDSLYSNWPVSDSLYDWYIDTLYYSEQACGRAVYEYNACLHCNFEGDHYNMVFGEGIGMVQSIHQCSVWLEIDDQYYLFYFKKDTAICGTPDVTSMSVNDSKVTLNTVLFYPNPASTRIQIDSRLFSRCNISIYNNAGMLVRRIENAESGKSIDISYLTRACYFLIVESNAKLYQTVLIKE